MLVPTTILADQHARTFERAARRLPDQGRGDEPLPDARRSRRQTLVELAEKKVDIVIGTHRLLSPDVTVRRARPHHRRRRASLRREAQGAAQAAQARDRRAHAHGDADPAHAAPVARRPARHDADADARRATARRCSPSSSPSDDGAHRRGDLARARSRRPGVLRAQPHRDDRRASRTTSAASCRARASRWRTGR